MPAISSPTRRSLLAISAAAGAYSLLPGLVAANHKLLAEFNWPHFWAIQILLGVLILMYCVASELARVIGRDKLKAIFFGPLPTSLK